jgi:hypothetical protein
VTTPPPRPRICWGIGCESGLLIRYPSLIDGGYVAVLSVGTWSVSLACPDKTGVYVEDAGGEYLYQCDQASLDFFWAGEYPPDARWSSVTTDVTIRTVDGGTLVPETRVVAPLSSTFDPDPDCPALCFYFQGEL